MKQFKTEDGKNPPRNPAYRKTPAGTAEAAKAALAPSQDPLTVPRKAFTRNVTFNFGRRDTLVIGGLADRDSDGYQPYVPPQIVAKRLGLDFQKCVFADPRETVKIEAARSMQMREYGVVDLNRKTTLGVPPAGTTIPAAGSA